MPLMAMMLLKQSLTRRTSYMAAKYKKTITIDRSRWCRGGRFTDEEDMDDAQLLTTISTMCCLGFFCHQMGIPKKELLGIGTPEAVPYNYGKKITALVNIDEGVDGGASATAGLSDSAFSNKAMEINDNTKINEKDREKRLKKLFAENDYRVVFVGRTPRG